MNKQGEDAKEDTKEDAKKKVVKKVPHTNQHKLGTKRQAELKQSESNLLDQYYTLPSTVLAIVPFLQTGLPRETVVLEPFDGEGNS